MNLEQFKELFNPLPGNHYLQVCTSEDDVTSLLASLIDRVDGKFNIALYNENNLTFNQPFRARPRDHDMVVIKDVFFKHTNKEMLLKLAYLTLANTANIIIIEKKGLLEVEATIRMLEKFEFRAPNKIDIIDGYDLVIGKKMHMWGAGL